MQITLGSASPGSHYFWYTQPIYIFFNFQQDGIQPGKIVPVGGGPIKINSGRRTVKQLNVTSLCDRPIQVSNCYLGNFYFYLWIRKTAKEPWILKDWLSGSHLWPNSKLFPVHCCKHFVSWQDVICSDCVLVKLTGTEQLLLALQHKLIKDNLLLPINKLFWRVQYGENCWWSLVGIKDHFSQHHPSIFFMIVWEN